MLTCVEGISLGILDDSDEILVGTIAGVLNTHITWRLPLSDRANPTLLHNIK